MFSASFNTNNDSMQRTAYKFYPSSGYQVFITGGKDMQTCITMHCPFCTGNQEWKYDCTDDDFDSIVVHYDAIEQ